MAPLLKTYFNPRHRSFLSTLFATTFLASVAIVTFPCPARNTDSHGELAMDSVGGSSSANNSKKDKKRREEIIVMMNERRPGKGRFIIEED